MEENTGIPVGVAACCYRDGGNVIAVTYPLSFPQATLAMCKRLGNSAILFGNQYDADHLLSPYDIAILKTQNLIAVTEHRLHSVSIYEYLDGRVLSGRFLRKFGKEGTGDGELIFPRGICEDIDGNLLVCDTSNSRVSQFNTDGEFIKHIFISPPESVGVNEMPMEIACDKKNRHLAIVFGYLSKCIVRVFKYIEAPSASRA